MTVWDIHLEVVESPDTDDFINSTRRFVNRRGSPSDMYSDCGTNVNGASVELEEFVENLQKSTYTLHHLMRFMVGAWERLVKSVKEVM